jgi:hypothetical protein
MTLRAPALVAVCVLVAPGASGADGRVITQRDTGKTFTVRAGGELTLRLSTRWRWTEPRVKGAAVRLVRVDYFVDPGFLEWEVDARARGSARISAVGHLQDAPSCEPAPCSPRRFRVRVVVR